MRRRAVWRDGRAFHGTGRLRTFNVVLAEVDQNTTSVQRLPSGCRRGGPGGTSGLQYTLTLPMNDESLRHWRAEQIARDQTFSVAGGCE